MKYFIASLTALALLCGSLGVRPLPARADDPVTITSPGSGDAFLQGDTMHIRWNQSGISSLMIGYKKDDGNPNGGMNIYGANVDPTATTGSYDWTIPVNPFLVGDNYKIHIYTYRAGSNEPFEALSSGLFSIREKTFAPLTVSLASSTPDGGEMPHNGQYKNIARFAVTNPSSNPPINFYVYECNIVTTVNSRLQDYMNLRVKDNDTVIFSDVHTSTCDAAGHRVDVAPGETRNIVIDVSIDSSYPSDLKANFTAELKAITAFTDESQHISPSFAPIRAKTFKVNGGVSSTTPTPNPTANFPVIDVLTPAGEENWQAGENRTIRWTASNLPSAASGQVDIAYVDIGNRPVGASIRTANSGSLSVTVPVLPAGNYKIRVKPACDNGLPCTLFQISRGTLKIAGTVSGSNSGTSNSQTVSTGGTLTLPDTTMYKRLKGKILLKTQDSGRAYYIHPGTRKAYSLGKADEALLAFRQAGVGISTANLKRIPLGVRSDASASDQDKDGLPDALEEALGLNKQSADSDGDGYNDRVEALGGYDGRGTGKLPLDQRFAQSQAGRILLQVEGRGEAWYVNPADGKRYFLGSPADAVNVIKGLATGISNRDFEALK